MPEIGEIVVKLQAQTAQFSSQMKRAQADIESLKAKVGGTQGAFSRMKGGVDTTRNSIGLLDNAIRGNMSFAMADLARRFASSPLMMDALPIAGALAGLYIGAKAIAELINKSEELSAAQMKVTLAQNTFETATNNTMRSWRDRLLEAEGEVDNLAGDHLAALSKEIEVINDQNLDNLQKSFNDFAKEADAVFKQLETSKLMFWDSGSKPEQNAIQALRSQYDLLSEGDKKGAAALLAGETAKWQRVVDAMTKMESVTSETNPATYAKQNEFLISQGFTQGFSKKGYEAAQDYLSVLKDIGSTSANIDKTSTFQKQAKEISAAKEAAEDLKKQWQQFTEKFSGGGHAKSGLQDFYRELKTENEAQLKDMLSPKGGPGDFLQEARKSSARGDLDTFRETLESLQSGVSTSQGKSKLAAIQKEMQTLDQWAIKLKQDEGFDPDHAEQYRGALDRIAQTLAKDNELMQKLAPTWRQYFQQMSQSTMSLSDTIRNGLQRSVTQFTEGFSQSMAHSIVYATSFGQAMRQVSAQVIEGFIQMGLEWLITQAIIKFAGGDSLTQQKTKASQLAGANAVASWSAAPWPIDMGAPAFGAAMSAAAMSFEVGGKIPGVGAVPIIGHGGETVVTKALTDRVERSERNGGGMVHFHYHDNSMHQALDQTGMAAVLANHRNAIQREVSAQLRRMNR